MSEQVPSKELGCYVMDGVTYTSHADGSETSRKATDEEVLLADALLRTSDELRVANKRIESYETLRNPAKGRLVHAGSAPEPRPVHTIETKEFEERANAWHAVFEKMLQNNPGFCQGPQTGMQSALNELDRLYSTQPPSPDATRYQWLRSHIAPSIISRILGTVNDETRDSRPEALDALIDKRLGITKEVR